MTDNDAEDIAAWQASWNTPAEDVDAVVRRAARSNVVLDKRVLEGHGNEVHAVTTADGQDLIVRICRRPGPVQRRIPGRTVHRLLGELSDDELATLTRKAAAILAAVHSVSPPGEGQIDRDGNNSAPPLPASEAMVAAMVERNAQLADEGFDPALIQAPVEAVARCAALLDEAPVSLIHGDWRTTNLLSDGISITGVVDWEGARGADPAFDFAGIWTVRSRPQPTSTELLLDSYRAEGGPFDERFDARRLLHRVADLHSALAHFVVTSRADLLRPLIDDLRSTLRRLGAVASDLVH